MFLHLGADVVVSIAKVVAILDLRTVGSVRETKEFLQARRTAHRVIDISNGSPKSLILTDKEVYLSPISSLTLKKRGDLIREDLVQSDF